MKNTAPFQRTDTLSGESALIFLVFLPSLFASVGGNFTFKITPILIALLLYGLSLFAVKAKVYGVSIINPALSLLTKHLAIGQLQKANNFSAFHWSQHGSLVSIGQHFVTTSVVHLPKRIETITITEFDRNGPNHRIGPGCVGHA